MTDSIPADPLLRSSHFSIDSFIRPNILSLQPYRCARDDYQSGILLDANENSLGHSLPADSASFDHLQLNRYPDPNLVGIKTRVAALRGLPSPDFVFLGVGSDEVIDLLMRVSCAPSREKILITPPTYGMYAVCAQVNDIATVKVPLRAEGGAFQLQVDKIMSVVSTDPTIKLIFICSPGNPTGTLIPVSTIRTLLDYAPFKGIVVVDEAYIDFSHSAASAVDLVKEYGNICVMQTLSKSFGLAAIRLGLALAQPSLIQILTNTKAPYNISSLTADIAMNALSPEGVALMRAKVEKLLRMRQDMYDAMMKLRPLGVGQPLGGSHANFLLVPILEKGSLTGDYDNNRAVRIYKRLAEDMGVVVRYRGNEPGCGGCVRITVGTEAENLHLQNKLKDALEEM